MWSPLWNSYQKWGWSWGVGSGGVGSGGAVLGAVLHSDVECPPQIWLDGFCGEGMNGVVPAPSDRRVARGRQRGGGTDVSQQEGALRGSTFHGLLTP